MRETPLVGQLLAQAATRLSAVSGGAARREATDLWSTAAGTAATDVWRQASTRADADLVWRFHELVDRRLAGPPLAHLMGFWEFRHLRLEVTPDVLIPRPETEGLVELVLRHVPGGRVADLGTGSGCIALALATEGTYEHVIGVERSAPALAVARRNGVRNGARASWIRGDFASALAPARFDAIVSNPPYLSDDEYLRLDASVREHEPMAALAGGPDGLAATRRVLSEGWGALRPGGLMAIELDEPGRQYGAPRGNGGIRGHCHSPRPVRARALPARQKECGVIWDKAQELGRLIGQSTEYQALRRAEGSLREDKDTVARLDQIQQLARQVDQTIAQGQMPDPAVAEQYETAVRELETSVSGQAYVVARTNFDKLMAKVNEQISQGIEKGAASKIITLS